MIYKFIIELTDDVKGYLYEIDYLEREYGIEPIEEHDKQIRTDAIEEFIEKADSAILQDFYDSDYGEYRIADVAKTLRKVERQLKEQNK